MRFKNFLFEKVDNSALVIFRVIFGFLLTYISWRSLTSGTVRLFYVEPSFTFNYIGFDFLQTFPGTGVHMYGLFVLMLIFGALITLGCYYRIAIIGYAILWTVVFLMEKSYYNNHYYLIVLLLWMFTFFPMHRAFSLDAIRNKKIYSISMPRWVYVLIITQLFLVYTFGSIAKFYPDWLDGTATKALMSTKKDLWPFGELLQKNWVHIGMAYYGVIYDALIIPALLWKPTRKIAFFFSIFFHLTNSYLFTIGIFPYMSLAFHIFFFEPKTIHSIFLKRFKEFYDSTKITQMPVGKINQSRFSNLYISLFAIYFIFQVCFPLRHHFYKDNVLWTEEGHLFSWRMMLHTKDGYTYFMIKDKETGILWTLNKEDFLNDLQIKDVNTVPDIIWQFAQKVKEYYRKEGKDVAVYAFSEISINNREYKKLIDNKLDLTTVSWEKFRHNEWILDSNGYMD